jgi:hypothetical protein
MATLLWCKEAVCDMKKAYPGCLGDMHGLYSEYTLFIAFIIANNFVD